MILVRVQWFGGVVATSLVNMNHVTNCYYLVGSYSVGINGVKDEEGKAVGKDNTYMTSDEFVNKLNEGNETDIWVKDEKNINSGFPILK